jgi:hypothetical protein
MFSRTLQSLTDFHGRLVETHHLHFGNFLAANIEDAQQRDATRAAIAAAMAHQRAADSSNGVGADRA